MRTRVVLAIVVFYSLLRFLFPSDIPFINDEALLIRQALIDGTNGTFTVSGLLGSRGVDYGPFAIWFYRAGLWLSRNLVVVALVKMMVVYGVTVFSLYWISKKARLSTPLLLGLALASPYLWFYSRDLWDNSFVIPLSAAFFAAYFDFVSTKRFPSLILTCVFLSLGFLTHLVFMPLLMAFGFHFVFFESSYYRKNLGKVLLAGTLSLLMVAPYLRHLASQHPTQHLELGGLGHLFMPFTGPRFFTSLGLEYFLGEAWTKPFTSTFANYSWFALIALSALAYPLFVFGLIKMYQDHERRPLFRVVFLVFLFQMILSFTYRLIPIPNFHSAQWVVYVLGVAVGLDGLWSYRWLVYPYVTSLGVSIPVFMLLVHVNGGSRFIHYGPTLGNQIEAARSLEKLKAKEIVREAFHPAQFPFALDLLRTLESSSKEKKEVSSVRIRYRDLENLKDGRIIIELKE